MLKKVWIFDFWIIHFVNNFTDRLQWATIVDENNTNINHSSDVYR